MLVSGSFKNFQYIGRIQSNAVCLHRLDSGRVSLTAASEIGAVIWIIGDEAPPAFLHVLNLSQFRNAALTVAFMVVQHGIWGVDDPIAAFDSFQAQVDILKTRRQTFLVESAHSIENVPPYQQARPRHG